MAENMTFHRSFENMPKFTENSQTFKNSQTFH